MPECKSGTRRNSSLWPWDAFAEISVIGLTAATISDASWPDSDSAIDPSTFATNFGPAVVASSARAHDAIAMLTEEANLERGLRLKEGSDDHKKPHKEGHLAAKKDEENSQGPQKLPSH
jgi:hypothetical protein